MTTVTLELPPEIEAELLKKAAPEGLQELILSVLREKVLPNTPRTAYRYVGTEKLSSLNAEDFSRAINEALREHRTVAGAARALKTTTRTVWRLVKKHGLLDTISASAEG